MREIGLRYGIDESRVSQKVKQGLSDGGETLANRLIGKSLLKLREAAPPVEEASSVRSGPDHQIEAGGFGKCLEVPVSRDERNPAIDTALGDQSIAEACLTAL